MTTMKMSTVAMGTLGTQTWTGEVVYKEVGFIMVHFCQAWLCCAWTCQEVPTVLPGYDQGISQQAEMQFVLFFLSGGKRLRSEQSVWDFLSKAHWSVLQGENISSNCFINITFSRRRHGRRQRMWPLMSMMTPSSLTSTGAIFHLFDRCHIIFSDQCHVFLLCRCHFIFLIRLYFMK